MQHLRARRLHCSGAGSCHQHPVDLDELDRAVLPIGTAQTIVVDADRQSLRIGDELGIMLSKEHLVRVAPLSISCGVAPPPKQISASPVLASAASGCLLSGGAVINDPHFIPMPAAQDDFIAFGMVVDAVDMHPIEGRLLSKTRPSRF